MDGMGHCGVTLFAKWLLRKTCKAMLAFAFPSDHWSLEFTVPGETLVQNKHMSTIKRGLRLVFFLVPAFVCWIDFIWFVWLIGLVDMRYVLFFFFKTDSTCGTNHHDRICSNRLWLVRGFSSARQQQKRHLKNWPMKFCSAQLNCKGQTKNHQSA